MKPIVSFAMILFLPPTLCAPIPSWLRCQFKPAKGMAGRKLAGKPSVPFLGGQKLDLGVVALGAAEPPGRLREIDGVAVLVLGEFELLRA